MATNIYGELDNGLVFLLTPSWLKGWQKDEEDCFKKDKQEDAGATSDRGKAETETSGQV